MQFDGLFEYIAYDRGDSSSWEIESSTQVGTPPTLSGSPRTRMSWVIRVSQLQFSVIPDINLASPGLGTAQRAHWAGPDRKSIIGLPGKFPIVSLIGLE